MSEFAAIQGRQRQHWGRVCHDEEEGGSVIQRPQLGRSEKSRPDIKASHEVEEEGREEEEETTASSAASISTLLYSTRPPLLDEGLSGNPGHDIISFPQLNDRQALKLSCEG